MDVAHRSPEFGQLDVPLYRHHLRGKLRIRREVGKSGGQWIGCVDLLGHERIPVGEHGRHVVEQRMLVEGRLHQRADRRRAPRRNQVVAIHPAMRRRCEHVATGNRARNLVAAQRAVLAEIDEVNVQRIGRERGHGQRADKRAPVVVRRLETHLVLAGDPGNLRHEQVPQHVVEMGKHGRRRSVRRPRGRNRRSGATRTRASQRWPGCVPVTHHSFRVLSSFHL